MSETEKLAVLVEDIEYDDLSGEIKSRARRAIRDYLGVALYGTTHESGRTIFRLGKAATLKGETTVLNGDTADPVRASMLNGAFGHAVDYDDTFVSMPLHPTTIVFPAVFSIGEHIEASGKRTLTAYVAGVETLYRVGHSVFPRQYDRGFHSTGAVGPLGSAAGAGNLLGLSVTELRHAFGIAASSAGGLLKNFGSMTKPLHAGFGSSSGVRAALLANEGVTADPNILDGELGYGRVMGDETFDPDKLTGDKLEAINDIGLKLYPSVHITHGSMEALRILLERESLDNENITSVTAYTHPGAEDVLLHENASNALQAKFSIQFCLAVVLREGKARLAEFADEYVNASTTRDAMKKIDVVYSDEVAEELGRYGGRVEVETTTGQTFEAVEVDAPGSPHNPVEDKRLREKFKRNVEPTGVDGSAVEEVIEEFDDVPLSALSEALKTRTDRPIK